MLLTTCDAEDCTGVAEPAPWDRRKRLVYYTYRHAGCHVGGVIVTVDGEVHRRMGPLFEPGRYGVGREYAGQASD